MPARKILVIDDSKVIRMRVKDMLPNGHFDVIEARDGLEGFNLICSENPNLIMLDFLLPKMSGWEVFQKVQQEQRLKSIPLVLMSGRKEEVTDKFTEPFEYFAFVEKPFDQKQLIDAIKEAMQKSKKHPTSFESNHLASDSDSAAEIASLKSQVAKMQTEINSLKKQLNQLVGFIKQKVR